ncbi:hypothetical protein Y032_0019g3910 [Ancylostoma ceylanicum]|uniref:Uncharacterized protein n=1 Tax=Ancylostoma ceylanicum TaxID=53326 RepID=A0A016V1R9_9BILA|nr:hypothetical protein Y032_0019g3910 [Ancylostoma ceylanicum]
MSKDQELDDLVDVPAGENEETPRQKSTKPQETGKRIESKEKIPVKSEQTRSSEERRRGKKGGKKHTSKKRKTRRKGAQTAGSRSESATDNVDLQIEIDNSTSSSRTPPARDEWMALATGAIKPSTVCVRSEPLTTAPHGRLKR